MQGVTNQLERLYLTSSSNTEEQRCRVAFPPRIRVWEKPPFLDKIPRGLDYNTLRLDVSFKYCEYILGFIQGDVPFEICHPHGIDNFYHFIESRLPPSVFPPFSKELHFAIAEIFKDQLQCYANSVNKVITPEHHREIEKQLSVKARFCIYHETSNPIPLKFQFDIKMKTIQPLLDGCEHGCISETLEGREICQFLRVRALKSCMALLEEIYKRFSIQLSQDNVVTDLFSHNDAVLDLMCLTFFGSQLQYQVISASHYEELYRMISCIHRYEKSKLSLSEALSITDNSFLKRLSVEKAWELFIDLERDSRYCYLFDVGADEDRAFVNMEFGYISSLIETFAFYLPRSDSPVKLTSEFIMVLHRAAIEGTFFQDEICYSTGESVGFDLSDRNLTDKGALELNEKISDPNGIFNGWLNIVNFCEALPPSLVREFKTVEECEVMLNRIIQSYESDMLSASSLESQKMAMVRFAQNLDQAHVFRDGNIRTSIMILNFLLIQNGEPPTLWLNPNILDGFSSEECFFAVCEGQERFVELLEKTWF